MCQRLCYDFVKLKGIKFHIPKLRHGVSSDTNIEDWRMNKNNVVIEKTVELLKEYAVSIKDCHIFPPSSENFTDPEAKVIYEEHLSLIESLEKIKF